MAAFLTFLLMSGSALAGKLDSVRNATGHGHSGHGGGSDDDDDDGCGFLATLLFGCEDDADAVSYAPAPPPDPSAMARQEQEERRRRRDLLRSDRFYLPYPYAYQLRGTSIASPLSPSLAEEPCSSVDQEGCNGERDRLACVDDTCYLVEQDDPAMKTPELRSARLQLFADLGQDSDGLGRGTLGLSLDGERLGLETRWTAWFESLGTETDQLWLGDANIRFQWLATSVAQLYVGGGVNVLADADGATLGPNLTAAAELYPLRPLVLRLEGDVGTLGDAYLVGAQGSVGAVYRNFELYVGAAHTAVDDIEFVSGFGGLRLHL